MTRKNRLPACPQRLFYLRLQRLERAPVAAIKLAIEEISQRISKIRVARDQTLESLRRGYVTPSRQRGLPFVRQRREEIWIDLQRPIETCQRLVETGERFRGALQLHHGDALVVERIGRARVDRQSPAVSRQRLRQAAEFHQ